MDWSQYIAVNSATAHPHYGRDGSTYNMGNSYGRSGKVLLRPQGLLYTSWGGGGTQRAASQIHTIVTEAPLNYLSGGEAAPRPPAD